MISPFIISLILYAIVLVLGIGAIIALFWWVVKDIKETRKLVEKEREIWRALYDSKFSIETGWRKRGEKVIDAKDLELDKEP